MISLHRRRLRRDSEFHAFLLRFRSHQFASVLEQGDGLERREGELLLTRECQEVLHNPLEVMKLPPNPFHVRARFGGSLVQFLR